MDLYVLGWGEKADSSKVSKEHCSGKMKIEHSTLYLKIRYISRSAVLVYLYRAHIYKCAQGQTCPLYGSLNPIFSICIVTPQSQAYGAE